MKKIKLLTISALLGISALAFSAEKKMTLTIRVDSGAQAIKLESVDTLEKSVKKDCPAAGQMIEPGQSRTCTFTADQEKFPIVLYPNLKDKQGNLCPLIVNGAGDGSFDASDCPDLNANLYTQTTKDGFLIGVKK